MGGNNTCISDGCLRGDLQMAKNALECEMYAGCLFHCQQGIEKCMKSVLALSGVLISRDHRISDLFRDETENFGEFEERFQALLPDVEEVEWYYIPTRYSVSTGGEVYVREFSKNEAGRICQTTAAFVELSRAFIEYRIKKPIPPDRKGLVEMLTINYADVVRRG
ncbi:MAG TPA: HEPN domain-containing protein [Methanosarcinales archaeon]|nr:HEPN domain-containing protein [Methanosarcinales archaeon]